MKRTQNHPIGFKQRLTLVLLACVLPALSQDPGFFLDDWKEKTAKIPASEVAVKPAADPTVTIHVDAGEIVGKVPQYIYGNNAVTWDNGLRSNATAMTDLGNLDPHVLRWPGGNLSNSYFWNRVVGDRPNDIPDDISPWYGMNTQNWQMSVDEYYDLLDRTNSTGIICVNYDYARYGTGPDPVATAAHLAAEWVRYDNGRSRFWEIGNENFGNWEPGYQIDVSKNQDGQPEYINGQLYGQHCRVFIDSMRTAAAEIGVEIKIGVVAYDAETSYDPIQTVWNERMMPEVGDLADFLIVHSYFTPYDQDSPVSTILNSPPLAEEIMSTLVADMAESGKPMLPVAFTEWNIFAVRSMQAVSYINGMHAALLLGEFIKDGYGQSSRWDLVNGWSNGDDHGMFSSGGEPGVDPYNPRPAFFYMYYFQKYFGDRMTGNTVSGSDDIIAYSSTFSSGETGLVLVNKGTTDETALVELENMKFGLDYYYYVLTGGTDNGDFSRKVFINGIGTDEQGGGPDEYASIKAYASGTEGGIKVALPALSVVYLMVDPKLPPAYVSSTIEGNASVITVEISEEVQLTGDPTGFSVMINGDTPLAVTGTEVDPEHPDMLLLTLESEVMPEDQLTLSYQGEDVVSMEGTPLAPFSDVLVENLLPGAAPVVTGLFSATDGRMVILQLNKKMAITAPSIDSFSLEDNSEGRIITIADIAVDVTDSTRLNLTPDETLYAEYGLVLAYEGSGISSVDGGVLGPFSMEVTNQSPGIPPVVVKAMVANFGFEISVGFDRPMAALAPFDSLFVIQVNGENYPVDSILTSDTLGRFTLEKYIQYADTVTFSYTGTGVTSSNGGVLLPVDQYPVENGLTEPHLFVLPDTIDLELFTINMGMTLEACSDEGGGNNLGYIDPGDWLEYEIEVAEPGYYTGSLRVAAATTAGQLVIQTPDHDPLDRTTISTPVTGGWQQWSSHPVKVPLDAGRQRLRLLALTGNYNLNWLSLAYDRPLRATFVGAATSTSGDTVMVEFDKTMAVPEGKNPAGLTLLAEGIPVQIGSVSWSESMPRHLLLVLVQPLTADLETITLSYEEGKLVDADQQPVIPFSNQEVMNEVTTSVASYPEGGLKLYPNPVVDLLQIERTGAPGGDVEVKVMDITGKTVILERYADTPAGSELHLEMGSLREGLYMVRIAWSDRAYHRSVLKK